MGLASVLAAGDPERVPLVVEARATAGRLDMAATVAEAEALLGAADLDVAEEVVADLGVAAPVAVSARVRTLGRFEVVGAGCEDPAHWSSRKARDALKIMICRRGRAIPREVLIDQLGPNVTLSVGRSRLSVVLSLLRVALDPERRFASDPLRADRQCVALDLDLVAVDVEELLVHAAKGLSSARQADPDPSELEEAARLAELGSFLAEDPYADFAVPLRATVERTHRDVLHALTQVGVRSGDAAGASRWLARLVELDPDDPLAHDALAAQLEVEGRFGAAD
jgi:DNA-binding SARP family transcriptional activator